MVSFKYVDAKSDKMYIRAFNGLGMEKDLDHVLETTSEKECFNVFFGRVGLSWHNPTLFSLVDIALELMHLPIIPIHTSRVNYVVEKTKYIILSSIVSIKSNYLVHVQIYHYLLEKF